MANNFSFISFFFGGFSEYASIFAVPIVPHKQRKWLQKENYSFLSKCLSISVVSVLPRMQLKIQPSSHWWVVSGA